MYLLSDLADGLVTIYLPQTTGKSLIVNFTPRDVNGKLNVDGMISLGSFSGLDAAKEAAASRYPIPPASWVQTDSPFGTETIEEHAPLIDGHHLRSTHE